MKNWISSELDQDFKIDIKIVDVAPEMITAAEVESIGEEYLAEALQSFNHLFPKS